MCLVQQVLLQGMARAADDAEVFASLNAVNGMLGDFVGTLLERQQYGTALGGIFGRTLLMATKKDICLAMAEINLAQQCAIQNRDKAEYEKLERVNTMLSEMLDYNSKGKGDGTGKGGVRGAADGKSGASTRQRSRSPVALA